MYASDSPMMEFITSELTLYKTPFTHKSKTSQLLKFKIYRQQIGNICTYLIFRRLNISPKCQLCGLPSQSKRIWLHLLPTCPNQLLSNVHTRRHNKVAHTIKYANGWRIVAFITITAIICGAIHIIMFEHLEQCFKVPLSHIKKLVDSL